MTREIRTFSRPQSTTSETVQKTLQSRFLLRPGPRFNALAIGALARAQELYPVQIHAFTLLSNHYHLVATYESPKQMADFHRQLNTRLSKEAGIAHDWQGTTVFPDRYRHVEISQEPQAEIARLKYVIGQGCKEGLVASPLDWPGASSTEALIGGETMKGVWVDRTALRVARNKGKDVTEADFSREVEVQLTPLPCLQHLSVKQYRQFVLELVRDIEQETAAMHKTMETDPMGAAEILSRDPHHRPNQTKKSPRPRFHAFHPNVRKAMRAALSLIVAAYRDATDRLKAGERHVRFPEHTFPPGLPFVETVEILEPG